MPAALGTLLLGRYRLEKHLKTGGFGAIYLACDSKNPNQQVVIKEMIVPDPAEFNTRLNFFIREAEILRLLNKKGLPTVPRYHGFFQNEEERTAHLILEFIPGRNLLEVMEANANRPFDCAVVVEWGKILCDVLTVMHGQNPPRIHRDVKPDNIMLLNDGRSIKMIDFGTAREVRLRPADQKRSRLTVVYSEDYAPPEQLLAWPEPRSDLFALAATLYHLVTGNVPRGVQTASDLAALLANPPAHVPRWFLELLHANLAVHVDERHPSALAFKEDLERQRVRSRAELYPPSPAPAPAIPPPAAEVVEQEYCLMIDSEPDFQQQAPPAPPEASGTPRSTEEDVWGAPDKGGSLGIVLVVILLLAVGGGVLGIRNGWFKQARDWIGGLFPSPGPRPGSTETSTTGKEPGGTEPEKKTKPADLTRPFKSRTETLALIRTQLESTRAEDRPFQRFFTLEHLYNNKRFSREVLDQHRDALARLLGQLRPGAAAPEGLGDGTVLRVDLRTLGWDQSGAWEKILAAYPYGLIDPTVQPLMDLAGNNFPFVRGDWFVATASQEPLFSKLAAGNAPQLSESIIKVRDTYRGELGLLEVVLELGLDDSTGKVAPEDPEKFRKRIQDDSRLQNLLAKRKLGPLARGESVSRESWTAPGGLMTPFQEFAGALGLGSAFRVRE